MKYNVTVEYINSIGETHLKEWKDIDATDFNGAYDKVKHAYKAAGCKVLTVKIKYIPELKITLDELVAKIHESAYIGLMPGNDKKRELQLIMNMIQEYRDQ